MDDSNPSSQHLRSDRVDVQNPDQMANWTRSLAVEEGLIREAVAAVGTDIGLVYDYVQRKRTGV